MLPSESSYDWLGGGIYFWESDPQRAWEWAVEQRDDREKDIDPFVVGAVIDLGDCLDLMSRQSLDLLRIAYSDLEILIEEGDMEPLPENHRGEDQVFRERDCIVINHLHTILEDDEICQLLDKVGAVYPQGGYDSVRGLFSEGDEIYEGAGFNQKTHIQLAVRNLQNIKGVFRVDESEYDPT